MRVRQEPSQVRRQTIYYMYLSYTSRKYYAYVTNTNDNMLKASCLVYYCNKWINYEYYIWRNFNWIRYKNSIHIPQRAAMNKQLMTLSQVTLDPVKKP